MHIVTYYLLLELTNSAFFTINLIDLCFSKFFSTLAFAYSHSTSSNSVKIEEAAPLRRFAFPLVKDGLDYIDSLEHNSSLVNEL